MGQLDARGGQDRNLKQIVLIVTGMFTNSC